MPTVNVTAAGRAAGRTLARRRAKQGTDTIRAEIHCKDSA